MQDELTNAIANDLGIAGLSQDEQQSIIAQFGEVALKAATISILEKLSEEKRNEFARIAESADAAALKTFLDKEVPDHESLVRSAVAEEVKKFKEFQNK